MLQTIVTFIHNGGTHPFDLDGLASLAMAAPHAVADIIRRLAARLKGAR